MSDAFFEDMTEEERVEYMKKLKEEAGKEFNLSKKRTEINYDNCRLVGGIWIREDDIKEFIKRLKENINNNIDWWEQVVYGDVEEIIDKLSGDKLI